jgi:hypothetical protein
VKQVRIQVRIDPPHPLVYHDVIGDRLNRAVLRMKPEKPRPHVTTGVERKISLPAKGPERRA